MQTLNEEEDVLSEIRIFEKSKPDEWTWRAGYMRSQLHWDSLRVHLEATPDVETVAFDDVMLVEINEPDSTFVDAEK